MRGISIRRLVSVIVLLSLLGSEAAFAAKYDPPRPFGGRVKRFITRVLDMLGVPPG